MVIMMLHYKLTIFFIFIILHLVKTLDRNKFLNSHARPDFFRITDPNSITSAKSSIVVYDIPTQKPHAIYYKKVSTIDITLSNVGLRKIGQEFINSNELIKLKLDNNKIDSISTFAFHKMPNLQYLDLSGNKIPKESLLSFIGSFKLQTLLINNNDDNRIVNELNNYEILESLKNLYLCNSQLQNLQVPYYQATPYLNYLHLSNNSISSSDVIFNNIPSTLTHLYVDNNLIDRVKPEKLRHLQELNMDHNIITHVCFENCEDASISLKGAVNMRNLSISRNKISEVSPNAFSDLKNLLYLDLSGNKIVNMSENIFDYTTRLTHLSLACNKLIIMPNICSMRNLKSLNLTENHISKIFIARCNSELEYLYLSNNPITVIENPAFGNLERLKYLDLSGNQLKQLPQGWVLPWNIQELHLERNNFTKLDDVSLIAIDSLKHVYLDENPMNAFEVKSFKSLPNHLTVHIGKIRILDKEEDDYNNEDLDGDYN